LLDSKFLSRRDVYSVSFLDSVSQCSLPLRSRLFFDFSFNTSFSRAVFGHQLVLHR
jgi:hypothetical protein